MVTPTARVPLNHYVTETPAKVAACLQRKACAYSILEKISWVAFLAIVTVVFAVSYTGVALTGNVPLLLVAMALSTPLFGMAASLFNSWSRTFAARAKIEGGVANELKAIKEWGRDQIAAFFQEQGLALDRVPLQALEQINTQEPLLALLPLIARFKLMQAMGDQARTSALDGLRHQIEQDISASEAKKGKAIPEEQKRLIRLTNREFAWRRYEYEALPRLFDAAVLLQLIQNPTQELTLTKIGAFRAKSFQEREFDRRYHPTNDHYFVFHQTRAPLTLTEVENEPPRALRNKLFP